MDGRTRRLRFRLTDDDLDHAIDLLCSTFDGDAVHREACETLRREAERREDGEPPQDIQMSSAVFDTLPGAVQALLFNHVSAEPRRAA
jgi:hypothetical protein